MKDLLKSKTIILFIVMVLGLTYINSNMTVKLDENIKQQHEIAINM